ncbi:MULTISPECIES: hypothetical protein [Pseudomonas]|uniref:Uncharacterized protein n=1 Tax=Pseudomonas fulva TaxID=47880 RepID=A0A0D0L460_9PSED|nr:MULTISPECIES: hypothetical protein [Pseudomonas]KIQ04473.1 hypothetical protein RU08_05920 [Pseudomonas fulva]
MTAFVSPPIPLSDIARDIDLDLSLVEAWVAQAQPFSDGSGYTVQFSHETPARVLALLPGIDKAGRLVVAYEDSVVRQRRQV